MSESVQPELCVCLANHWSFTGIGWQMGLESCAQSIADSLTMADYDLAVKTGINLDALAYELVAQHYPDLIARLREYLEAGRVEIIGGTFGQPMGSMVSGESNLRQLLVGQETIRRAVGRNVAVFLEEEEMSHPQMPQLLKLAGYKYASLAQCDTWGRHGAPKVERNVIVWEGVDGTRILATPSNKMVFHPPVVTHDIDWLWSDEGRAAVREMTQPGQPPLIIKWTEFGWESLTGKSMNKFDPEMFKALSAKFQTEYVTIEHYLDRHARGCAGEAFRPHMDDFAKLLPWGVGGDQLRRFGREVESTLLAAERFDTAAHALRLETAPRALENLNEAWRNLLAAQSHDVSLCEYSRWQGLPPPREPLFPNHCLTWGARGYQHMDRALDLGRGVLRRSVESIAQSVDTSRNAGGASTAVVVFNACPFDRDAVVNIGKLNAEGSCVRDSRGRDVPYQRTTQGELLILAKDLPSIGYDIVRIEKTRENPAPTVTDLRADEAALTLQNAHVAVTLDRISGAIATLVERRTGAELLSPRRRHGFPTLSGRPNVDAIPARHRRGLPDAYGTSTSQAEFTWLERGPVRATVRASHSLPWLRFDVYVSLCAHSPRVDVHARLFPGIPPKPGEGNINGWQFDLNIDEGYWLEFAPAFDVATVVRDYPFGVEPCGKRVVDALTFVDLLDADGAGLLIAHSGTQYFKRRDDGVIANLAVREWESHYTGEYGWPRVCEYRYSLTPHSREFTNAQRLRAAAELDERPMCVVAPRQSGKLPPRQSFVGVEGGAVVSAFRRSAADAYELRLFECEGSSRHATVRLDLPLRFAEPEPSLRAWEIKTLAAAQRDS